MKRINIIRSTVQSRKVLVHCGKVFHFSFEFIIFINYDGA